MILTDSSSSENDKNCKTNTLNIIMIKNDTIFDLKQKLIDKNFIGNDKKVQLKFDNEKLNEIYEIGTINFR